MAIPDPFVVGQIIDDRWRVVKNRSTSSSFTWQYHVRDVITNEPAFCTIGPTPPTPHGFVDLERNKLALKFNAMIVKELDMHGSQVPRFITYGECGEFNYMCTEMVGPDLASILEKANADSFSLSTALNLGMDMLDIVREVHERGYLLRHLSPSIFVLPRDPSTSAGLLLVPGSFMLTRRYLALDGETTVPLRRVAAFRGSLRYASIFALRNFDQTRMDDMWQWFYMVVYLVKGDLGFPEVGMPLQEWTAAMANDKETKHNNPREWLGAVPDELYEILEYLKTTPRETPPDYSRLFRLIKTARIHAIGEMGGVVPALDWEPGGQWHEILAPLMKEK